MALVGKLMLTYLVPWKEAEEYWKELRDGKYEWSSIGKQLRQKGIVLNSQSGGDSRLSMNG